MTVLTYQQVYALARGAGLNPGTAMLATAIARGESGFNTEAVGDVGIQTAKWGPSVGLWQIRSVKAETGKGTSRDITRLKDPAFNARAMAEVSGLGKNFKPWSVYTNRSYLQYLSPAGEAATAADGDPGLLAKARAAVQSAGAVGSAAVKDPGAVLSSAGSAITDAVSSLNPLASWQTDAQGIAIKSLVLMAGCGLFVAGAIRLVMPATVGAVRGATGL